MKSTGIIYRLVTLVLQAALVAGLFMAGRLIYQQLPAGATIHSSEVSKEGAVHLIMRPAPEFSGLPLDIAVELYPVDIVAVRHEYFIERREGKRFDDFLNERMNGRTPVTTRLDRQGNATILVTPGNWWVHAVLSGDEDLEWRLPIQVPIEVTGPPLTVELTPHNAYARTKSF